MAITVRTSSTLHMEIEQETEIKLPTFNNTPCLEFFVDGWAYISIFIKPAQLAQLYEVVGLYLESTEGQAR